MIEVGRRDHCVKSVHRRCRESASVEDVTGNRLVDAGSTASTNDTDERAFLQAFTPSHDEIQREMAAYAADHGFPIIGAEAGGLLRSVARATDARRIFEFGSGFGYSAYWLLQGMPADGEIVLTESDADELEMAEGFFKWAGLHDRASFEHGDAMTAATRHDGPFDVVLIDHRKALYPDAFAAIRRKLPVGSVVVADNVMRPSVVQYFGSGGYLPDDDGACGLIEYLEMVRSDEDFHTTILPIGNGLALSTRVSPVENGRASPSAHASTPKRRS